MVFQECSHECFTPLYQTPQSCRNVLMFYEVTAEFMFILCFLNTVIHLASRSCQSFLTFVSFTSPTLGPSVLCRSLRTSCWVSEQTCCQTFVSMDRPHETFSFAWPCLAISFSVCISASSSCAISCLHYSWPQFGHQSLSSTSPQLVLTRPLQLCGWCASAPIICLLRLSHTWWGNSTHHSHLSTLSPSLTHSHSLCPPESFRNTKFGASLKYQFGGCIFEPVWTHFLP